jgi:hypothetical protein
MVLALILVETIRNRFVIRASSRKASLATTAGSLCMSRKETVQSMEPERKPVR